MKEERKSSRSFGLDKGGKRSFDLEKHGVRSFDLTKDVDDAKVKQPVEEPQQPNMGEADSGEKSTDTNNKKWLWILLLLIAVIAAIFWGMNRNNGGDDSPKAQPVVEQNDSIVNDSTKSQTGTETSQEATEMPSNSDENVSAPQVQGPSESTDNSTAAAPVENAAGDVESLVKEVLSGKYGNWPERERMLGNRYNEVQKRVNEMYRNGLVK